MAPQASVEPLGRAGYNLLLSYDDANGRDGSPPSSRPSLIIEACPTCSEYITPISGSGADAPSTCGCCSAAASASLSEDPAPDLTSDNDDSSTNSGACTPQRLPLSIHSTASSPTAAKDQATQGARAEAFPALPKLRLVLLDLCLFKIFCLALMSKHMLWPIDFWYKYWGDDYAPLFWWVVLQMSLLVVDVLTALLQLAALDTPFVIKARRFSKLAAICIYPLALLWTIGICPSMCQDIFRSAAADASAAALNGDEIFRFYFMATSPILFITAFIGSPLDDALASYVVPFWMCNQEKPVAPSTEQT